MESEDAEKNNALNLRLPSPLTDTKNDTDRYMNILTRLFPYENHQILKRILTSCDNDLVVTIESILPTQIRIGNEWVPRDHHRCTTIPTISLIEHVISPPQSHVPSHDHGADLSTHTTSLYHIPLQNIPVDFNGCFNVKQTHTKFSQSRAW